MARARRSFAPTTSYHVTMRCNNRAFDLRRPQSRKALLFCLAHARRKFGFALFGVCSHLPRCRPIPGDRRNKALHEKNCVIGCANLPLSSLPTTLTAADPRLWLPQRAKDRSP
jgi:hypothetical protein